MQTNEKVEVLRRAFDESFAALPRESIANREKLLAIRAGEGHFAVRVSEIAGVETCRKIVALPGERAGLLGVAGVRRRIVAVYGLGVLLGARPVGKAPRWLLACSGEHASIALAIEEVEQLFEVAPEDLLPVRGGEASEHVGELVLHGGVRLGVVRVPSLVLAALEMASSPKNKQRGARNV